MDMSVLIFNDHQVEVWYVYILRLSNGELYKGFTNDLSDRIHRHKSGAVLYTSKYLPLELLFYATFIDKYKALAFEKYLKSGSGRAFTNHHLV